MIWLTGCHHQLPRSAGQPLETGWEALSRCRWHSVAHRERPVSPLSHGENVGLIILFQAKKVVSYAESGDEDEEDEVEFRPTKAITRGRALKRRKTVVFDEGDFSQESEAEDIDEGMKSRELSSLTSQSEAYFWMKFRRFRGS